MKNGRNLRIRPNHLGHSPHGRPEKRHPKVIYVPVRMKLVNQSPRLSPTSRIDRIQSSRSVGIPCYRVIKLSLSWEENLWILTGKGPGSAIVIISARLADSLAKLRDATTVWIESR